MKKYYSLKTGKYPNVDGSAETSSFADPSGMYPCEGSA
ncbi:hypothetical protein T05_2430 [Trichinella murrelli]|uniref:Uncharacterized protein n=1 Tax=Trichinella murrelli TaxID=144512 RepID=A0A0V0SVM7_9BILA|nr:hypothetical protein T05_2430 [Trichinella murrelli]